MVADSLANADNINDTVNHHDKINLFCSTKQRNFLQQFFFLKTERISDIKIDFLI